MLKSETESVEVKKLLTLKLMLLKSNKTFSLFLSNVLLFSFVDLQLCKFAVNPYKSLELDNKSVNTFFTQNHINLLIRLRCIIHNNFFFEFTIFWYIKKIAKNL